MRGMLVVAHGSRREGAHDVFRSMVTEAAQRSQTLVEAAFLEFSDETISWGLNRLTGRGATRIEVLPYFLFEGVHTREDIREQTDRFCLKHPGVEVEYGDVFGSDPRILTILEDRIRG